jgi:predicted dehydrogenase
MARRLSRRQMLAASAATLGYLHLAPAFSVARVQGSNEKLRVAGIGVGGKGSSDIDDAGSFMEVVALCDVDDSRLAPKAKKWPKAATFADFRKIFDDAALLKNIDAFTVSTADHTHALPSILAMRAGKHVYCQKPLTHDVFEAHLMRAEAKKNKVCTQMGNQGTAANGLRKAVEYIRSGALGEVKEVHVWTNRPGTYWKQAPDVTDKNPPKKADVPKGVHWDEFLGPAPEREYAGGIHPFAWRGFWDYGTGAIGDMACHTGNMAFMALKLAHPTHVSADASDVNTLTAPSSVHATLKFPARGSMPPVTLHWYEGKKDGKNVLPAPELVKGEKERGPNEYAVYFKDAKWNFYNPKTKNEKQRVRNVTSGSFLVGSKATLFSPDDYGADSYIVTPDGVERLTGDPEKLPINGGGDTGQKKEWVEAIKANKPELALANFGYAGLLTAAFLLGNVAVRTGKPFTWDGERCVATDNKDAARFVRREYRKGWDLIGYNDGVISGGR